MPWPCTEDFEQSRPVNWLAVDARAQRAQLRRVVKPAIDHLYASASLDAAQDPRVWLSETETAGHSYDAVLKGLEAPHACQTPHSPTTPSDAPATSAAESSPENGRNWHWLEADRAPMNLPPESIHMQRRWAMRWSAETSSTLPPAHPTTATNVMSGGDSFATAWVLLGEASACLGPWACRLGIDPVWFWERDRRRWTSPSWWCLAVADIAGAQRDWPMGLDGQRRYDDQHETWIRTAGPWRLLQASRYAIHGLLNASSAKEPEGWSGPLDVTPIERWADVLDETAKIKDESAFARSVFDELMGVPSTGHAGLPYRWRWASAVAAGDTELAVALELVMLIGVNLFPPKSYSPGEPQQMLRDAAKDIARFTADPKPDKRPAIPPNKQRATKVNTQRAAEVNKIRENNQAARNDAAHPKSKLQWLAEAMLLVKDHPEWPDAKIAKAVGKSPSTLSRSLQYQNGAILARQATSRTPPKGYVTQSRDDERGYEAIDDHETPD